MTLWPFSRNTLGEKVPRGNASHYPVVKWEEGMWREGRGKKTKTKFRNLARVIWRMQKRLWRCCPEKKTLAASEESDAHVHVHTPAIPPETWKIICSWQSSFHGWQKEGCAFDSRPSGFVCVVCMLSLCQWGFSPGSTASSRTPKTCIWDKQGTLNEMWVDVNVVWFHLFLWVPVMNWRLVQGVTLRSPSDSCERLQLTRVTLSAVTSGY